LNAVTGFSNQENIIPASEGETHPQREKILGAPPLKDWCYFYQRAEWYRQQRQWAEIVRLYDSIEELGLRPEDASEWVPFIEALDRVGDYARADALVFQVTVSPNPRASQSLRVLLERLRRDSADLGNQQLAEQVSAQLARLR
jgi:hypothetical protein